MRIRKIHRETWVKASKTEVFQYFANPENLLKVTPPEIPVTILNDTDIKMEKGTIINLKMKLFGFLPIKWQTKIEEWEPPHFFVDVQPKGPYRYWKHTHSFQEKDGGTLILDHVEYAVPGYFLEPIIHRIMVKNSLVRLFDFRQETYPQVLEKFE